jgi:hypothetical protein
MEKLAVLMARALIFIEISELNQTGKLYVPAIVSAITKRYGFVRFPEKTEQFDIEKGIEFGEGTISGVGVERLAIFGGTILIETQVSTDVSKTLLLDFLSWLRDEHGATFKESQIRRWVFISQLLFKTDFPLLAEFSAPLSKLAERTSAAVSEMFGEELKYHSLAINIGHDPTIRKHAIAGFQIQHRGNIAFEENRYYSEAPLPTDLHLELLEQFEREVLESRK